MNKNRFDKSFHRISISASGDIHKRHYDKISENVKSTDRKINTVIILNLYGFFINRPVSDYENYL